MTPGVFLYHPGRAQVLPKLRAFIEHIKAASGVPSAGARDPAKRKAALSTPRRLGGTDRTRAIRAPPKQ
jgi:hypothetical protein